MGSDQPEVRIKIKPNKQNPNPTSNEFRVTKKGQNVTFGIEPIRSSNAMIIACLTGRFVSMQDTNFTVAILVVSSDDGYNNSWFGRCRVGVYEAMYCYQSRYRTGYIIFDE